MASHAGEDSTIRNGASNHGPKVGPFGFAIFTELLYAGIEMVKLANPVDPSIVVLGGDAP